MDAPKRNLQQTSPDIFDDNTPKKHSAHTKMAHNTEKTDYTSVLANVTMAGGNDIARPTPTATPPTTVDCFSWAVFDLKLNNALDAKLETVVKKDDIASIATEIQQLRNDNTRLQNELQIMKSRLEQVDKASRRNNIVISGLGSKSVPQALGDFKKICNTTLKTDVNVVEARKIAAGKSFLFTLNSATEVNAVLSARRFLVGSKIYIDKDYTADVRNKRYFLRQIGTNVKKVNKHIKVRYGDYRIFIDDKPFSFTGEKIIAVNNSDAEFLKNLMSKANYECNIEVKDSQNLNTEPAAAASSAPSSN